MSASTGKLAALAAFSALLISGAASGEPLPKPTLRVAEVVAVTANGCAMIAAAATDGDRSKYQAQTRRSEWRGPCHNGLAHGSGVWAWPNNGQDLTLPVEFFYGRIVPDSAPIGDGTTVFSVDGRKAEVSNDAELDRPRWPAEMMGSGTWIMVDGVKVKTQNYGAWPPDYVNVYGVQRYTDPSASDSSPTEVHCPNERSPAGCEGLWQQMAGPLISAYRDIRGAAQRKTASWRAEISQLNAARDASFAVLATAAGQAFDRGLLAAAADTDKSDREFKAKLTTANAGQLYAMADQFERAGDSGKAGEALRALLSRFPDHALAVTAAQHLSALPPPQAVSIKCDAPRQEANAAMALNAAMSRIAPSNAVWKYEAVLATIQNSAGAWSRCPSDPSGAAKVRAYRGAYVQAAQRCAMISPTGTCTPSMH